MFIFSEASISFKMTPGRKTDAIAFMLNKSPTRATRKPFIKSSNDFIFGENLLEDLPYKQ